MKKALVYISLAALFFSCQVETKINSPEPSKKTVINSEFPALTNHDIDTIAAIKKLEKTTDELDQKTEASKSEVPKKPKATQKPKEAIMPLARNEKGDQLFYFEGSKQLSVKETPWNSDKRRIFVYGRKGNLTYEIENVRMSYQSVSTVNYRKNGSVESIDTHENPGASRYWYETHITFSEDNVPLEKSTITYPMDHLSMPTAMIWDPSAKTWIKK
jgi:hypothetical protein